MQTPRWRWVAIGGVAALLLAMVFGVWWAGRVPPQPSQPGGVSPRTEAPGKAEPLVQTGPLKLQGLDDSGRQLWEVMLSKLEVSQDQSLTTAYNMEEAVIFDKAGQAAVRLTAKQWKYDLNSKNFEVTGDVRVLSKRGIAFKTQRVQWANAKRDLICPGPVTAIHKNVVIRTGKLILHMATDRVDCPTTVTITTQTARGKADRASLDLRSQSLTLVNPRMTIIDLGAAKKEFERAQREASPPASRRPAAATARARTKR